MSPPLAIGDRQRLSPGPNLSVRLCTPLGRGLCLFIEYFWRPHVSSSSLPGPQGVKGFCQFPTLPLSLYCFLTVMFLIRWMSIWIYINGCGQSASRNVFRHLLEPSGWSFETFRKVLLLIRVRVILIVEVCYCLLSFWSNFEKIMAHRVFLNNYRTDGNFRYSVYRAILRLVVWLMQKGPLFQVADGSHIHCGFVFLL